MNPSTPQPASAPSPRPLEGRKILLGVTGGIAIYKSLDLIGRLQDQGAAVRVVMTDAATRLVSPIAFQARTGHAVYTDMWRPAAGAQVEHIDFARWPDLLIVAPLTANTMAKFALGLADDPLSTLFLAWDGPVLAAPTMNTVMLRHPATVANLETLRQRGARFVAPVEGRLACGEVGAGKMAEPADIVEAAIRALTEPKDLAGRTVLITAGPTREPIDPVRFVSNPSSGKMGYALAAEALRRGAEVILVTGPVALAPPPGAQVKAVVTAAQMRAATVAHYGAADLAIFCAAVADYTPAEPQDRKVHKTEGPLTLTFVRTADIAAETARLGGPRPLRVGFAAETHDLDASARAKQQAKGFDFLVANDVSQPDIGFGADQNRVVLYGPDGVGAPIETLAKDILARRLFDVFVPRLADRPPCGGPGGHPDPKE